MLGFIVFYFIFCLIFFLFLVGLYFQMDGATLCSSDKFTFHDSFDSLSSRTES